MNELRVPPAWLTFAVAGAAAFAIFPLPYGYYQLLRLVVTGYAAFLAWHYFQNDRKFWPWAFTFLSILYNPVFIITMSKDFHMLVNLVTAGLILWDFRVNHKNQNQKPKSEEPNIHPKTGGIEITPETTATAKKDVSQASNVLKFCLIVGVIATAAILYLALYRSPTEVEDVAALTEAEIARDSELLSADQEAGASDAVTSMMQQTEDSVAQGADPIDPIEDEPLAGGSADNTGDVTHLMNWRGKEGRCKLTVSGKKYIDGECWVRLDTDGSFQVMSQDETYFAQLHRSEGEAIGHWNETPSAPHAHTTLGTMTRSGACWKNSEAEICAWSR